MTRLILLSIAALVVIAVIAASSCKHGEYGFIDEFDRGSWVHVTSPSNPQQGYITGLPVSFRVDVTFGEQDIGMLPSEISSKVEIDPGDGSGFLDFTTGYMSALGTIEPIGTHVYSNPGEYTIQSRVTYWDGEVIIGAIGTDNPTIVVSAAE